MNVHVVIHSSPGRQDEIVGIYSTRQLADLAVKHTDGDFEVEEWEVVQPNLALKPTIPNWYPTTTHGPCAGCGPTCGSTACPQRIVVTNASSSSSLPDGFKVTV